MPKTKLLERDHSTLVIEHKDRIAQMSVRPVWRFKFVSVESLDETDRQGGFGSTGNK